MASAPGDSLLSRWGLQDAMAAAINPPFIESLAAGTLAPSAWSRWLVNDYVFVSSLHPFLSQLIASMPASHTILPTLRSGHATLTAELDVFRAKASERHIALPDVVGAAGVGAASWEGLQALEKAEVDARCVQYARWLTDSSKEGEAGLAGRHWTVRLAAYWVLEKVYCDAMWRAKNGEGFARLDTGIREFVEWWANDEFRAYVSKVGEAVKEISEGEGDSGQPSGWRDLEAKSAVETVLRWELEFWAIGQEGAGDVTQ